MGVVCRATQLALGRTVALKVIAPDFAGDPTFRHRFRQECRLAASLDHPNIVPIIEAGEDGGLLFVSMRWVDGVDLGCLVDNEGPLAPRRALAIVAQVASALDVAHGAGLIHRDVKPANILIEARHGTDHAYLGDFGLVKRVGSDPGLTGSHGWIGTVDYVAPEQVRGEAVGVPADVYALGAVLYTALTATVPFGRPDTASKLWACVNDPLPPLGATRPDLPAGLDGVLAWAMAKDPTQRCPSAGGLVAALQATLAPPALASPTLPLETPGPLESPAQGWSVTRPAPTQPDPAGWPASASATPPRPRRRWAVASALVAVAGLVALAVALSGSPAKTRGIATGRSATSVGATGVGGAHTQTIQLAAAEYGPVTADLPAKPIGAAPSAVGGIQLEVYDLARSGANSVTLVLSFHNTNPAATGFNNTNYYSVEAGGNTVDDISLFDPSGLKEYLVYSEPGTNPTDPRSLGPCLCSTSEGIFGDPPGATNPLGGIAAGQRVFVAALFPAPPSSVKEMTVQAGFGTIPNVPLSNG